RIARTCNKRTNFVNLSVDCSVVKHNVRVLTELTRKTLAAKCAFLAVNLTSEDICERSLTTTVVTTNQNRGRDAILLKATFQSGDSSVLPENFREFFRSVLVCQCNAFVYYGCFFLRRRGLGASFAGSFFTGHLRRFRVFVVLIIYSFWSLHHTGDP